MPTNSLAPPPPDVVTQLEQIKADLEGQRDAIDQSIRKAREILCGMANEGPAIDEERLGRRRRSTPSEFQLV